VERPAPDPRLEPYLFTPATVDFILDRAAGARSLLLLGCPTVAARLDALDDLGPRRILDLDPRHAHLSGFRRVGLDDLPTPRPGAVEPFDLLVFDPPACASRLACGRLLARLRRRSASSSPTPTGSRPGRGLPRVARPLERRPGMSRLSTWNFPSTRWNRMRVARQPLPPARTATRRDAAPGASPALSASSRTT
jgi:hypothetical protein